MKRVALGGVLALLVATNMAHAGELRYFGCSIDYMSGPTIVDFAQGFEPSVTTVCEEPLQDGYLLLNFGWDPAAIAFASLHGRVGATQVFNLSCGIFGVANCWLESSIPDLIYNYSPFAGPGDSQIRIRGTLPRDVRLTFRLEPVPFGACFTPSVTCPFVMQGIGSFKAFGFSGMS